MKTLRIFAFVLFGFFATASEAQMQFGIQTGPQFPLGDMADYNMGFGVNVCGKYFVKEDAAFGLNIGYSHYGTDWDDISCSFMPITALFEYHLSTDALRPYLGFDLGLYNVTVEVWGATDSELHFGFAPTAGIMYELKDNLFISGNLKWNYVMTDNDAADWVGLNLGIAIGL